MVPRSGEEYGHVAIAQNPTQGPSPPFPLNRGGYVKAIIEQTKSGWTKLAMDGDMTERFAQSLSLMGQAMFTEMVRLSRSVVPVRVVSYPEARRGKGSRKRQA